MVKGFGQWASDAFVSWTLFLSSYAPLLVIFAVRLGDKHPDTAFWIVVCAALFALNLVILLNRRVAPRDFKVHGVKSGAGDVAAYIATYLLPFLVVSDVGWRDLLSYAILVLTIGVVMTREGVLHINPLLALGGWHISTITTIDGAEYYLVSTRRAQVGDVIRAIPILARLLMER